jgi:hypothetical protein
MLILITHSLFCNDLQVESVFLFEVSKFSTRSMIFSYPKPDTDTELETIKITTKERVNVSTDYRTPLKGISLPGSSR